ncbi:hypothetical protein BB558_000834 [Smittium angustum]|uniref:LSM2-LSM8 complex subunit LSM8 n=1 Tax=Smittium angustum TaxID=133377 RepID=A0A2U1JD15_SMIAN|nr:hypothetical protein BB558_000834 [Smittium angustum]
MAELHLFVDKKVAVMTNDGRILVGMLTGFDQTTNLILQDSVERVFGSGSEGVEFVNVGLYLIRGDEVAMVGLVDEKIDEAVDWQQIRCEPLPPIKH